MKPKSPVLPPLTTPAKDEIHNFLPPDEVLLGCAVSNLPRVKELVSELMTLVAPGAHQGDNLITWGRNMSALGDEAFRKAWLDNCIIATDVSIMWRRYILCTAAIHCVHLQGDFVECGTLWGTGIKTIVDYFGRDNFKKTFWGYDTFDYNPVEGHAWQEQQAGFYQRVVERFRGYNQVQLIPGFLPGSLVDNSPQRIAFLHIDLNSAVHEINTLEALFDRLVPGGILVLDDYEWAGVYREQKLSEDQWFHARGYRVIPLPTGQGILVKR
jgi:hypothetical protein